METNEHIPSPSYPNPSRWSSKRPLAGSAPSARITLLVLAALSAGAWAQTSSAERNAGMPPAAPPQVRPQPSVEELQLRRARLKAYFRQRRARLPVVATTVTDSGQVIDWVPREALCRDGIVAEPPPDAPRSVYPGDQPVRFELDDQPHARGPAGTVPIPRRDLDLFLDKIRPPERLEDFLSKHGNALDVPLVSDPPPDHSGTGGGGGGGTSSGSGSWTTAHEYADTDHYVDNLGTFGYLNVWNPYVYKSNEFSLAQVAIVRGSGTSKQTIEAGWQDYEGLYGDTSPHLFVYYTTNGYTANGDDIGGYNSDVDGFVQYSSTVFPGEKVSTIQALSVMGGSQYSINVGIRLSSGNWWIKFGDTWVGYYPASLFATTGLRSKSDKVSWYGEVVDDGDGVDSYTDMGSGQFPSAGWRYAAYMRNLEVVTTTGASLAYNGVAWVSNASNYDIDTHFTNTGSWGSYMYYGGPGRH
jgi:hypothetical protein